MIQELHTQSTVLSDMVPARVASIQVNGLVHQQQPAVSSTSRFSPPLHTISVLTHNVKSIGELT